MAISPPPPENPISILVVDDEADLEFLITRRFKKQIRNNELRFWFARNGLEALRQLEKTLFTLISMIAGISG